MELRIDINNRRKQFAGISRDHLCDFQYGVKKKEALNRVSIPKQKAAQYEQMAAHPEIVEKFGTRGAGDQRSCFGR